MGSTEAFSIDTNVPVTLAEDQIVTTLTEHICYYFCCMYIYFNCYVRNGDSGGNVGSVLANETQKTIVQIQHV